MRVCVITLLSMQLHKELFVFAQKKKVLRADAVDKLVNEKRECSLEYIDTFLS